VNTYLVACSGPKLDRTAPAAELYTGTTFANTYATACQLAAADRADGEEARVLIVSARYGLVDPADVLAPYDVRMTDADAVTVEDLAVQMAARQLGSVYCLLPAAYWLAVWSAAEVANADDDATGWIAPMDVFEAAPGVGFQRGVCRAARAA
jgi:hypothetical protein